MLVLYFFYFINLIYTINYLYLNDEYIICICLLLVFIFIVLMIRKFILYNFLNRSDYIYSLYITLLKLNKSINKFLKIYLCGLFKNIYYIIVSNYIIILKQIFFFKLINNNYINFLFRVKNVIIFLFLLKNILLSYKNYIFMLQFNYFLKLDFYFLFLKNLSQCYSFIFNSFNILLKKINYFFYVS